MGTNVVELGVKLFYVANRHSVAIVLTFDQNKQISTTGNPKHKGYVDFDLPPSDTARVLPSVEYFNPDERLDDALNKRLVAMIVSGAHDVLT